MLLRLPKKLELSAISKQTIKTKKFACGCRGRECAPNSVVLFASIYKRKNSFIIHFSLFIKKTYARSLHKFEKQFGRSRRKNKTYPRKRPKKTTVRSTLTLGASKCPIKGGFANGSGRTAYLTYACGLHKFEKRYGRSRRKNKSYPRKRPKKLLRSSAHYLGTLECRSGGGFANGSGFAAYLTYACGLHKFEKRYGRSRRKNKSYPRKRPKKLLRSSAHYLGTLECRSGGGFANGSGFAAYLAYARSLRHS